MDLVTLIEKEGRRNNCLKDASREGEFPSLEVAKEIGSEELYRLANNSIEFRLRINLEIIQSSYHLVKLMEQYLTECEKSERIPECDLDKMRTLRENYSREVREMTQEVVDSFMKGYEASW